MSSYGGANIVTNGLTLLLDASNIKSYVSGSSTWYDISNFVGYSMTPFNGYSPIYGSDGPVLRYIDFSNVGSGSITTSPSYINNSGFVPISSSLSLEAWIRRDGNLYPLQDRESIFSNAGSGTGFRFNIDTTGIISYLVGDQGGSYTTFTLGSGYNLGDNKWHQTVISFDILSSPGNVIITGYLDGRTVGFISTVKTIGSIGNPGSSGISYACCSRYKGYVARLAAYGRVLTAVEVLQNYNALKSRFNL